MFDYILWAYSDLICFHLMCRSDLLFLLFQDGRQQNIELYKPTSSFKVICDFQVPMIPIENSSTRKFGPSPDFLPISHYIFQL